MTPEELAKNLKDTAELRSTLIQRAVLILEGASKEEAPSREGTLRRSITSRASRDEGVIGTNVAYAGVVHGGSRPHIIRARNRKALFWPGATHPVRSVNHPGTKANPFFERALDRNRDAIDRMAAEAGTEFFSRVE